MLPLHSTATQLIHRIQHRESLIGVVGMGYVGLPFAVEKAKVGFKVIGFDRSGARVDKINRGENYIPDVDNDELAALVSSGGIRAVTGFDDIPKCDVIVICVPTPLTKNLTPDLQYVEHVTREVGRRLRPGVLISLESTTYPGTTEEIMLPILQAGGLQVNRDFFLAHSPERVDPGNQRYTTKNTNKVVGGVGEPSLQVAVAFYQQTITHVVPVENAKTAELVKVFENTYRAVNIALVNELAILCDRMQLNVWHVLDAAFTKPFGIMPFYPGPGVGGHCIPIDPHYLEWKAKELDFNTRFISLAGEINRKMPDFVVDKAARVLNNAGLALSKAKVLAIGAAYKKDLGDWRESPAIEVMKRLAATRTNLTYHDPWVPEIELDGTRLQSTDLTNETLSEADLCIILTDHTGIDWQRITDHSNAVLDTRYATRSVQNGREKITLL
jgi:nucleotide sugar dehydrogenase